MYDLLSMTCSRILVAVINKNSTVIVPRSNLIISCLHKMYLLGYLNGFKLLSPTSILVLLKYSNNKPIIRRLVRLSTPGKRLYYSCARLRTLNGNKIHGFFLISTSKGVLTEQECFFYNCGGEPLFLVY